MNFVERYHIVRELGRGAMGVVYLATDMNIRRPVALKILINDAVGPASERDADPARKSLMREARSAGILSHPGVVTIYDLLASEGQCCIVMEYIEGKTLRELMDSKSLSCVHKLDILRQTARALDYAHERGVVHRDIKPANLFIEHTGRVKIGDFGIARMTPQRTVTGLIAGTPMYMAPEQIQDAILTGAADQFSLAAIACELICGKKPFESPTISGLLWKVVSDEPDLDRVPLKARQVLSKALAKTPRDRFSCCEDFVAALTVAWDEAGEDGRQKAQTKLKKNSSKELHASTTIGKSWRYFSLRFGLALISLTTTGTKVPDREPYFDGLLQIHAPVPAPPAPSAGPSRVAASYDSRTHAKLNLETARIVVYPHEARIIVDGKACTNPCSQDLAKGVHRVIASLDGYADEHRSIELPHQTRTYIRMDNPVGYLILDKPRGARIYVDGAPAASTAPMKLQLPVGRHTVSVEVNGVRGRQSEVVIRQGLRRFFD